MAAISASARPSRPRGIRDIAAESVLIAAGGRAILLQIANPAVGLGVAEHSDFTARPTARLANTLAYIYAVVYGTAAQRAAAVAAVGQAHAPVRSSVSGDDLAYSAFDPRLQLWVAATLYDSAVDMHQRIDGALDAASAELVYREYAVLGTALQLPRSCGPPTSRPSMSTSPSSSRFCTPMTRRAPSQQPSCTPRWGRSGSRPRCPSPGS